MRTKLLSSIIAILASSTALAQLTNYPGFSTGAVTTSSFQTGTAVSSASTPDGSQALATDGIPTSAASGSASAQSDAAATDSEIATLLKAGIPVAGDWTETATKDYYNGDLHLAWIHTLGDYDPQVVGSLAVRAASGPQQVTGSVTGNDFYIMNTRGGYASFASRLSSTNGPKLVVNGTTTYSATRNVAISASLSGSLGGAALLKDSNALLIAFDDYSPQPGDKAQLVLTSQGKATAHQLVVHRPTIQFNYPQIDAPSGGQIVRDIRASDFKTSATVSTANGIVTGHWGGTSLTALSQLFKLPLADEYFLTVVIRLGTDWANLGGKLPGLADTGQATNTGNIPLKINGVDCDNRGWGGRTATGCRWSARTGWGGRNGDQIGLRTYYYAQRPSDIWGVAQPWPTPVSAGKWFAYVQRVKLNTPGQGDGRLSYWLCTEQGCAAQFDRKDIAWRAVGLPQTQISEAWADVYCGGTSCGPAPFANGTVDLKRMTVTTGLPDLSALLSEVHGLNQAQ